MWKQCTKCKKILPLYLFNKLKSGMFGLKAQCKYCERKKSREYYKNNRETEIQRAEEWRKNNMERVNSNHMKLYYKDKDRFYGYMKKWELKNPGKRSGYQKKWRDNNPEKVKEYNRKYYLLKFNSEGWHTPEEWDFIKKLSGYKCLRCGRTDVKLTEDHITPLSEGGHDYILNIQPLCGRCNSIKGVKFTDYRPPEVYKAVLEYFS